MSTPHRLLAVLTASAVFGQGCAAVSRNYVVETQRAVAVDEAFYFHASTVQIDDLGYCMRIPLDMGISLAGLEEPPEGFDYVVAALDYEGHVRRNVSTRYRIFPRGSDVEGLCKQLEESRQGEDAQKLDDGGAMRDGPRQLGSFSLPEKGLPQEKSLTYTFRRQRFANQKFTVTPEDWQRGFVTFSEHDLVARFERAGRPYHLRPGEQIRVALRFEGLDEQANGGTGAAEIDLQKVRKPRGWLALLLGVTALTAGTVAILKATDQ